MTVAKNKDGAIVYMLRLFKMFWTIKLDFICMSMVKVVKMFNSIWILQMLSYLLKFCTRMIHCIFTQLFWLSSVSLFYCILQKEACVCLFVFYFYKKF